MEKMKNEEKIFSKDGLSIGFRGHLTPVPSLTAPTARELERPCPLRAESAIRYVGETGAGLWPFNQVVLRARHLAWPERRRPGHW
jgi:hypothetical protein